MEVRRAAVCLQAQYLRGKSRIMSLKQELYSELEEALGTK